MSVLIKGGTVVDAERSYRADVYCTDGLISAIGESIDAPSGAQIVDADVWGEGEHLRPPS